MKLRDLLQYDKITIQCHDNPDADALASGFALHRYLTDHGKQPDLIYSGRYEISKDNLKLLRDELNIPIEYRRDNTDRIIGLLVTVDCQYGALNVTKFQADDVIIIDHHQQEIDNIEKTYIASAYGSCSTFIWKLMTDDGYSLENSMDVQTALYYGLYSDTIQFTDISNPVDMDMRDELNFDSVIIHKLMNSNISAKELEIAGVAMIRSVINDDLRFAVVRAEPCDPNILGLISDMVLQVSTIDYCIVFTVFDHGIKFSVRSCVKEAKANDIAAYVSREIGSGGGHLYKAGGFIGAREYDEKCGEYDPITYFSRKLTKYTMGYDIIDTRDYTMDVQKCKKYIKKPMKIGFVKATDILNVGEEITVRTLEGDFHFAIERDTYIMIGIKGEIYPIMKDKFDQNYEVSDEPYDFSLEYHPKAKINTTGESFDLLKYVRACYTTNTSYIYARKLEKGIKIFTQWDRECYMLGEEGDYLGCHVSDLNDVYVIEKDIFSMTYDEVEQ